MKIKVQFVQNERGELTPNLPTFVLIGELDSNNIGLVEIPDETPMISGQIDPKGIRAMYRASEKFGKKDFTPPDVLK